MSACQVGPGNGRIRHSRHREAGPDGALRQQLARIDLRLQARREAVLDAHDDVENLKAVPDEQRNRGRRKKPKPLMVIGSTGKHHRAGDVMRQIEHMHPKREWGFLLSDRQQETVDIKSVPSRKQDGRQD